MMTTLPTTTNLQQKSVLDTEALFALAKQNYQNLIEGYPAWQELLAAPEAPLYVNKKNPLASEITAEERLAVFEKLRLLFDNANLLRDLEMRLYLEQQLSDLCGLQVVSELEGFKLPNTTVKVQAGSHQLRKFADQLNQHLEINEALIDDKRSHFGWLNDNEQNEQFGIGLPLFLLEEWQKNYQKTWAWFKYRKLLLINPWKNLMAVASVTSIAPKHLQRYQAISNPELSRQTQLWFPGSFGKACLFLIENAQTTKLGLIEC